ncbi:porin [Hyphomicrobium sp. CS1GBMeth3]|uniref:porin n=1 Tax=Hyphomicrobium sp. CS1GBMeth3 TaxID=1892845 RepID=UPI000931C8A2|nr:porin [Hyphomicrobium sp. CS1GBMeth3]
MKKHTLSALAAAGLLAGGLSVTSASAADLGGNCCADLEERIAELEATTARKGNRKVSLTISGWVAEQVTWWDDGHEDNVYVGGLGTTIGTNVKFTGQATIVPGWTAGYVLHLEADGSDSLTQDQNTPSGPGLFADTSNYVQTLQSYWFIKSESLGKVSVGLQSMVSDNAAILVDGSGSLIPANWVAFNALSFNIRDNAGGNTGATWGGAGGCIPGDCYGVPTNSVRYDSPTFAGFSVSASWGDDDVWDAGIRYAGEFAGFKLAATAVYAEATSNSVFDANWGDSEYFQAGAYLQHIGTGLFGLVNYGNIESDAFDEAEIWYFKAGIRQRWTPLGHTVLYGEYMTSDSYISNGDFEWWGLGGVQEIDNAAMSMFLKYREYSLDGNAGACALGCEDFQEVTFGALINF